MGRPGPRRHIKTVFSGMEISIMKIRRSRDCRIFIVGIAILVRRIFILRPPPGVDNEHKKNNKTISNLSILDGKNTTDLVEIVGGWHMNYIKQSNPHLPVQSCKIWKNIFTEISSMVWDDPQRKVVKTSGCSICCFKSNFKRNLCYNGDYNQVSNFLS